MNLESSRLRTFKNWPANAVIDARRIAKAGFYYMGHGLEVQCFSCGGRISEWNYGDKVMAKHRWLDPRCPFVVNPESSGNVPIENSPNSTGGSTSLQVLINDRTDSTSSHSQSPPISPQSIHQLSSSSPPPIQRTNSVNSTARNLKLLYQRNVLARLNSFEHWPKPHIVTPESLARAGFYYTGESDTVKCAFCDLMVGHWEEGDDPFNEHMRHFPNCSFLIGTPPPPCTSNNNSPEQTIEFPPAGVNMRTSTASEGFSPEGLCVEDLGVHYHKVPKHPKYSIHEARLQTFVNWPEDVSQTPEELAAAGFYYAGSGDQVKCFHCDGGLRRWDPQDDPWIEHSRWYPQCGFIVLVKGQSFIDSVLKDYPPLDSDELDQIERVTHSKIGDNETVRRPSVSITEAQLQELMSSPAAVAALQVGLEVSRVKVALRQRAESGGLPFHSPEALINAALDVQLAEAPEPDHSEAWGTPPSSPVSHWPRSYRNNRSSIPDQSHNEGNTSEGNTTETEDVADFALRINNNENTVSNHPSDEEENDNHDSGDNFNDNDEASRGLTVPETTTSPSTVSGGDRTCSPSQEEVNQRKVSLEEENRRLKEARLCKICMDREISIVFLPCGHLVTCVHCAHSLADCPVCRKEIIATVRTFLS